ncbi:G2/mitotic-specific cyclin S13-7-like [Rutidosis leptorrhynchoides]|uniref:G2/mitotic-specific cyclin S13-7-like n=1 Tax=Rutidosis leptorrhynchoides TaxID=125765 RepID=UPI003A99257A
MAAGWVIWRRRTKTVADELEYHKTNLECEMIVGDYFHLQPELNARRREELVNWLLTIHSGWKLAEDTLYMSINILDRFLSLETVTLHDFYCGGIIAMLIAAKYAECQNIGAPNISEYVNICH